MEAGFSGQEYSEFADKQVLIVGACGDIGKACAMWLINHGAKVAIIGRNIDSLKEIEAAKPSQVIYAKCDLAADTQVYDRVVTMLNRLDGLDILINAASIFYENDLETTFPQDHDYIMDINLRLAFFVSSLCFPALSQNRGRIINVSGPTRPQQGMISFCMSIAGLNALTRSLSIELSPIKVNTVAPWFINNNFFKHTKFTENDINKIKKTLSLKNPLRRLASISEITKVIIFLCSDLSNKINGEIINVDGGMHATSSSFVHWDCLWKMNSKFLPSDLRKINKFSKWFLNKYHKIAGEEKKPQDWVKQMVMKSNWSTSLADAHIKVYNNYDNISEDEDYLGIIDMLRDDKMRRQSLEYSMNLSNSNFPIRKNYARTSLLNQSP